MKIVISDSRVFRESIYIISEIVTEARFLFKDEGVELISTDPGNISMVEFKAPKSFFDVYEINKTDGNEQEEVCFDISRLKEIFKRIKTNNSLTLETTQNKLQIIIEGASKKTFSLPLLTLDVANRKVPDLSYNYSIKMPSSLLTESLEDISLMGDVIVFEVNDKKIYFRTPENSMSSGKIEFEQNDVIKILGDVEDKNEAYFSIEYLKKMVGASKISPTVEVKFKDSYPLTLVYKEDVSIRFILAPRQKD
ncbi:MAG: hypothetical protein PHT94_01985 [Candidatus Nanoarchaeia archaeon]|nr:hypothetical protein [Candidatus Nanoarchaeia archaeon]